MNGSGELCTCGEIAVLFGRCSGCFSDLTRTAREAESNLVESNRFQQGERYGGGRFTLVERLGEGGMGTVWLADDEQLSVEGAPEQVALKFIVGRPDAELINLLRKEVRAALRLSDPNIVRVHSWHEHPGEPVFYSMEFVPGLDLKRLMANQPLRRFSARELEPFLSQLIEALKYAHDEVGVVHRDLKPANLLVTPGGRLKLADFGLARRESSGDIYATTAGGTLPYSSPQQLRGAAPTFSDDIYSLGAVIYHLLTGVLPYSPEDLASHRVRKPPEDPCRLIDRKSGRQIGLPREAADTLLRCLRDSPTERPPDINSFWLWWRVGPPLEKRQRASRLVAWAKNRGRGLAKIFMLICLVLFIMMFGSVLVWKLDVNGSFEERFPRVFSLGQRIGNWVVPPTPPATNISKPETVVVTPSRSISDGDLIPIKAELTIAMSPADHPTVEVEIYRANGTVEFPKREEIAILTNEVPKGNFIIVTGLEAGLYIVEAGIGHPKSGTTWVRKVHLHDLNTNLLVLDFHPAGLNLFVSEREAFEVIEPWGEAVAYVAPANLDEVRSGFRAGNLKNLKLLGGQYRLRSAPDSSTVNQPTKFSKPFTIHPGVTVRVQTKLE